MTKNLAKALYKPVHWDAFLAWHKANAEVYELFKQYTFELIDRGHTRGSSDSVMHRIRWHKLTTHTEKPFKLNDNWSSCYSRLFVYEHQQYPDFFEFRKKH